LTSQKAAVAIYQCVNFDNLFVGIIGISIEVTSTTVKWATINRSECCTKWQKSAPHDKLTLTTSLTASTRISQKPPSGTKPLTDESAALSGCRYHIDG